MKIKALHLFGFKSFADRTELNFDRQIVGIVGPNGCGKSNTVDAIRWAMGEQSAKGLRGSEMQDVIFSGTATRKRANFAEVSIVFENNQGLAPAPYTDCAEIMITRRLYRSGESEYLINKVNVRLKDITDLFLGTGSSARAYSVVAQGKIDQIVLAKPEERRFLLEEAAGVAKYKARKVAAERKMEATRENLARIEDIVRELDRNARHLERQAEKAEQFRKVQTELRQLDEQIIGAKVVHLESRAQRTADNRDSARMSFEGLSTELAKLETDIEKMRLDALNLEKVSASDYEQLIAVKESFAQSDKEKDLRAQRIQNLLNQIDERKKDIERLQSKREANLGLVSQLLEEKEELRLQKIDEEKIVSDLKSRLEASVQHIAALEIDLQGLRQELDSKKEEQIRSQNRREIMKSERVELELKRAAFEESIQQLKTRSAEVQTKQQDLEIKIQQLESDRVQAESSLLEVENQGLLNREQESATLQDLSSEREALSRSQAELESLRALEQHHVGYDPGALKHRDSSSDSFIMDQVQFHPEYQSVAQAFLGELGQCFTQASNDESSRWGRVFFDSATGTASSFERSLLSIVSGEVPEALRNILSSIELVDQLPESPVSHAQIDLSGRSRIPLSQSVFKEEQGAFSRSETPFGRKAEEAALLERISHSELKIKDFAQQIESLKARGLSLRSETEDLRKKIKTIAQDFSSQRVSEAQLKAARDSIERQSSDFLEQIKVLDARITKIGEELAQHVEAESLEALETQMALIQTQLDSARAAKAELDSLWIEKRIAFGALSERLERLEQQTIDHEMTRSEYEHNQSIYQQDIENWERDIQKEKQILVELEERGRSDSERSVVLEKKLAESKVELNKLRSEVEQQDAGRRLAQSQKDEAQTKLQELELEHQKLKFEVEELSQLVQERYHIGLEEVLNSVTQEQLDRLSDETVLRALEVDALELREKLEKFGEVNLLALSEFEEIKKRLDFMTAQREDLLKTLDSLQSIIDRVNKITEFRFRETFTAINHNFQVLFPKLFGGGRAYMTLTDDKNMLETGVEIFAEPPGKRVQAMSLLSGGEKAMTSISLLFALFAYRPASFCILDEVDAPLDEINTQRYNQIIQDMSGLSQFIVITHNKRTMEVADKLFGVTMQEAGVSQLVAVELQEARAIVA